MGSKQEAPTVTSGEGVSGERAGGLISPPDYTTKNPSVSRVWDPGQTKAKLVEATAGLPPGLAATIRKQASDSMLAHLKADGDQPLDLLSARKILTTAWPEPVWAIPGLLPVGLTIMAGKPKVGKSWLALQLALAVATGGMALGVKVKPGPVLYLALEDTPTRLQERMRKQGWPPDAQVDFLVMGRFWDEVGDLKNGGGEKLAREIEHKGYRMTIVDTLSRCILGDQNDAPTMTAALGPVQEIAHGCNCAVVLLDHHHKLGGLTPDAIADILGSTAKGAMADTTWGLYRERGKQGAKLAITGRDVEEQTLALTMAWDLGSWQCEGNAEALEMTERRREIVDVLHDQGRAKLRAIADAISQDRSNTYRRLQDLVAGGQVKHDGGWYSAI